MQRVSRRTFTALLFSAAFLRKANGDTTRTKQADIALRTLSIPDTIAGHVLTQEEKDLAARFISEHEEGMTPLREIDLPNSLAPSICYRNELATPPSVRGSK